MRWLSEQIDCVRSIGCRQTAPFYVNCVPEVSSQLQEGFCGRAEEVYAHPDLPSCESLEA
jgi:hypothetical protein